MWNELKSKVNCRLNESELHNCGAGCSRLKCSQQHSGQAQGDKTSPLNQNLIKALWSDKCRPTDHFSLLLRKLPNRNRPEPTLESKLILQKFMILLWAMCMHWSNEYHDAHSQRLQMWMSIMITVGNFQHFEFPAGKREKFRISSWKFFPAQEIFKFWNFVLRRHNVTQ